MTDHIETLRAMLESPVWIGAPEDRDALQAAIRAIESLRGGAQPTTVPREPAPPSSLPDWSECQMRCANSDYVAKRKEEGGHGEEPGGMYANELHRFIYEYDDADRYRSEWFMYRLEKLIEFIRSTTPELPEGEDATPAAAEKFTPTRGPQECASITDAVMLAERALWQDDEGVRWVPEAAYQRMVSEVERMETNTAATSQSAAAQGWVMVPREPTQEMIDAELQHDPLACDVDPPPRPLRRGSCRSCRSLTGRSA